MGKKADQSFDNKVNKLGDEAMKIKYETQGNNMKTTTWYNGSKAKTFYTVLTTLAVLAAFGYTFLLGVRYEADRTANVNAEAAKLVEQLKSQSK